MYSRRIVADRMKKMNVIAAGLMKNPQRSPGRKKNHHIRILGRNVSMTAGSTPKSVYFWRERNPTVAAMRSNKMMQKRQTVGVSTETENNENVPPDSIKICPLVDIGSFRLTDGEARKRFRTLRNRHNCSKPSTKKDS